MLRSDFPFAIRNLVHELLAYGGLDGHRDAGENASVCEYPPADDSAEFSGDRLRGRFHGLQLSELGQIAYRK